MIITHFILYDLKCFATFHVLLEIAFDRYHCITIAQKLHSNRTVTYVTLASFRYPQWVVTVVYVHCPSVRAGL